MKNTLMSLFACLALCSWGGEVLPGGFVMPELTDADRAIAQPAASMRLRKPQDVYLTPGTDGTIAVTLANARVIANKQPLDWTLYSPLGEPVMSGSIPVDQNLKLKTKKLPTGVYRLHVDAGDNSARVSQPTGMCFVKTDFKQPFHSIFECPKLYFLTAPSADRKVHLKVWGDGWEHCIARIWDADGKEIYHDSTLMPNKGSRTLEIALPLPPEQLGRAWSIQLFDVNESPFRFEDMYILLQAGTVPALALAPAELAAPVTCRMLERSSDGSFFIGVDLSPSLMTQKGVIADFAFEYGLDGRVDNVYRDIARSGDGKTRVGLAIPKHGRAIGRINYSLKDGDGRVVENWNEYAFILEGKIFNEVIRQEDGTAAVPTAADKARGYQIYRRDEPGFVRRYSRPNTEEIIGELTGECSPGMVSTEFFALQPLADADAVTLSISDLKGPKDASISAKNIGLFSLTPHLKKEDYTADTLIDAPEVLDRNVTKPLKANFPQQFCVQVVVPANAVPGDYSGVLMLNGKAALPYRLTVDDFVLPEVPAMSFGLYPDTERWKRLKYTDAEILAEMKMFRQYGMTALLMYPLLTAKLKWDGKALAVDLTEFRRQIQLYKSCGFYGVLVIDIQSAVKEIPAALGIAEFTFSDACWNAYRDILRAIRAAAIADDWPRYCIHSADEPNESIRGKLALESLKIAHDMGFKTFNTCYPEFVRSTLDPYLDYRCYNNMGYSAFLTEKNGEELRKETLGAGDDFWWYGSGSYSNGMFLEQCNIYTNRHLLGIHNWRVKATGAWSWTFCRPRGNQFDDFDGVRDDCMAFQDPESNTMISALQWEAAREGIYDYRYLKLWENTVIQAKARPELKKLAADSEKRVNDTLKTIAWTAKNFAVRNGQLNTMRKLLIQEITELNKAMK